MQLFEVALSEEISLSSLGLSNVTLRKLESNGCESISQLVNLTKQELRIDYNMTEIAITKLEEALWEIGKCLNVESSSGDYDDDLERLGLSKRSATSPHNILVSAGINSISKLTEHTSSELLELHRLGVGTVNEIKEKLKDLDKSLRDEDGFDLE